MANLCVAEELACERSSGEDSSHTRGMGRSLQQLGVDQRARHLQSAAITINFCSRGLFVSDRRDRNAVFLKHRDGTPTVTRTRRSISDRQTAILRADRLSRCDGHHSQGCRMHRVRASLRKFHGTLIETFSTGVSNWLWHRAPQHANGRIASMWTEEVSPERSAEFFRHYRQALEVLANGSGSGSWREMAKPEKNHLVAAARLTILGLSSTINESAQLRQYFAKPGEAEWGC